MSSDEADSEEVGVEAPGKGGRGRAGGDAEDPLNAVREESDGPYYVVRAELEVGRGGARVQRPVLGVPIALCINRVCGALEVAPDGGRQRGDERRGEREGPLGRWCLR